MTSVTEDNLNSEIIDGKPLETLTITSIGTLRRANKKYDREVSKLVYESLYNKTCQDLYNKTLDNIIENQSTNCNIVRECLSPSKRSELHHLYIESTQDASPNNEHFNFLPYVTFRSQWKQFRFQTTHEMNTHYTY